MVWAFSQRLHDDDPLGRGYETNQSDWPVQRMCDACSRVDINVRLKKATESVGNHGLQNHEVQTHQPRFGNRVSETRRLLNLLNVESHVGFEHDSRLIVEFFLMFEMFFMLYRKLLVAN